MQGAFAKTASAQVPAGERGHCNFCHGRAQAAQVLPIAVACRHEHFEPGACANRCLEWRGDPCFKDGAMVERLQRIGLLRQLDAGNRGKGLTPFVERHQRAVNAPRMPARGWSLAIDPAFEHRQRCAQQRRTRHDIGQVLADAGLHRARVGIGPVLRSGPGEDSNAIRFRQVVALRIRVHERAAPIPVLRRGLGMDHERVGTRPLEDRVAAAGDRIDGRRIRERKTVRRVGMGLVLARGSNVEIAEAVHVHPARARDVRQHAIEHARPFGGLVESAIDELPDGATGLRATPGQRRADAGLPALRQRVGRTALAAQHAHEVSYEKKAEIEYQRVLRDVAQLVDPPWLEAAGEQQMGVGRHDAGLAVGPIAASDRTARLDACQGPGTARHDLRVTPRVAPAGEHGFIAVLRVRREAAGRGLGAQRKAADAGRVGNEFRTDGCAQRLAVVPCRRHLEHLPAVAGQHVRLPCRADEHMAAAHQPSVAGVDARSRVVGRGGVVEELQAALVAPVEKLEEQGAAAERQIDRLQDPDVGTAAREAVGAGTCELQVIGRFRRDLARPVTEAGPRGHHFVGAGVAEDGALRERLPRRIEQFDVQLAGHVTVLLDESTPLRRAG